MWKDKLKLEEGETLRFDRKYEKGSLGQEEVELYSAIDPQGQVTSSVQYIEHTSIKAPFRRSFHLVQKDNSGNTLIDDRWSE